MATRILKPVVFILMSALLTAVLYDMLPTSGCGTCSKRSFQIGPYRLIEDWGKHSETRIYAADFSRRTDVPIAVRDIFVAFVVGPFAVASLCPLRWRAAKLFTLIVASLPFTLLFAFYAAETAWQIGVAMGAGLPVGIGDLLLWSGLVVLVGAFASLPWLECLRVARKLQPRFL